MELSYTNKKGKSVSVNATNHAIKRFSQRFYKLNPTCNKPVNEMFERVFNVSTPMCINGTKKYKKRNKRKGGSTVYLRSSGLTFVVENQTVVTVEISAKNLRHMN